MSAVSSIEWTQRTWNPTSGCDRVSTECDHCYALTLAARLKAMGQSRYQRDGDPRTSGPGFGLAVHRSALGEPYRWRQPSLVFVNSMSDLFHMGVPDGFVADVWRVMGETPHTYQILTRRPARMERWVRRWADLSGDREADRGRIAPPMPRGPAAVRSVYSSGRARLFADVIEGWGEPPAGAAYPLYDWMEGMRWWPRELPNVWLGASVGTPAFYGRIRHLQRTPAVVRFLSCEPLLAPLPDLSLDGIHWVIVGGESGPGARPCELEWLRDIRDQCAVANVPLFVKQVGAQLARDRGSRGKGGDPSAWPADLRVREMPRAYHRRAEDLLFAGHDHA